MAVLKSFHELDEVMSSNSFFKSASHGNEIEEFSTFCKLEYNIVDFLGSTFLNVVCGTKLNCLNNINIFQLMHSFNFSHEKFFFFFTHVIVHDFDGYLLFCKWINT